MRITSNGFGKKNKNEDIKEYTLDGTVYYVDFSDIREFDGVEAAIVYDENEEVIGAMAENGEAIDTDGNAVGKMKEKSSGFGSNKSSGFGSSKKSSFGSSKKSSFGSSKSSGGFGSKSKGVPCMVPDDDTVYYVTDNEVEAFDIAVLEIVNKAGDVVGGVTEDGELMDLKGNNIGDIILEDDEEEKSSGFGSKKKSGFGSSKSSGFGSSKKSSGFGSSKSSGFGSSKKSSGFGSSKSSGFGNNLKDNPGASSLRSKLKSMK